MFRHLLRHFDFEFQAWNVIDNEFPLSFCVAAGWLITGSKFGVNDQFPWIRRLEQFLRQCYADHAPIVGICFGHQILASALGGKVEKAPQGWNVGRYRYDMADGSVYLNAWHQDQVIKVPQNAKVIGSSSNCQYAMLSYENHALSIQAHPEFSRRFLSDLIPTKGIGMLPDELLRSARSDIKKEIDQDRVASIIGEFFHAGHQKSAKIESSEVEID